jgi:hypothetical protein
MDLFALIVDGGFEIVEEGNAEGEYAGGEGSRARS